jgi:hypothetical protein
LPWIPISNSTVQFAIASTSCSDVKAGVCGRHLARRCPRGAA